MKTKSMSKAVSLLVLVALLVGAIVPVVSAQSTTVAASSVQGLLSDTGSKHYLGLKVLDPTRSVKVVMDYRQDSSALDGGSGFYIFNEEGFGRFIRGASANETNLAAGALDSSSGLKQKIAIISDPVGTFSIVTYNDSNTALDYTLTAENALIVDDSGEQVTNAAAPREVATTEDTAAETATTVATVEASTTVSETVTATATPTPAAAVSVPVITRAESLQADLPEQYSKHYFDLSVADTNASVDVSMSYDPQDQQILDNGFNFYVYSSDQFQSLIRSGAGPNLAENTAAGTLTTVDGLKTFQATINTPFRGYTVIVGNDSTVPVSYTLTVKNGLLVDASGQSNTAQAMMAAGAVTTTATAGTAAETTTTTTTTTSADPTVAAGSVYVVKSGDTIATIARAAYGDVNLWDELCAFNSLENCDRIEVGDEINVPAQAELGTGAVAPAATATPAAAATTPVAATEPATTTTPIEATTTVTTTTTAPAASGAGTIIDVATNARQFEILLLALSLSNLTDGLKGVGPFTLFAPADAAFAGLPEKTLDSLLADTAQLSQVLQFHVVPQNLTAANITDGMTVTTLMGQDLTFGVSGGNITVNGASVNTAELPASNGTVFIIDSVLLPAQ